MIIDQKSIDAFKPASVKKYYWPANLWGAMIIGAIIFSQLYSITWNNLHLPTVTCLRLNCNLLRRSLHTWSLSWRIWTWIWNDCSFKTVSFNQVNLHSHCIINAPEVELLDGVGVWVMDACVGGLTVAAVFTTQIQE